MFSRLDPIYGPVGPQTSHYCNYKHIIHCVFKSTKNEISWINITSKSGLNHHNIPSQDPVIFNIKAGISLEASVLPALGAASLWKRGRSSAQMWRTQWYVGDTVDGSEIRRSPVEVGSLSHYQHNFIDPRSQVVQDFFHQQYVRDMLMVSFWCIGWWRYTVDVQWMYWVVFMNWFMAWVGWMGWVLDDAWPCRCMPKSARSMC